MLLNLHQEGVCLSTFISWLNEVPNGTFITGRSKVSNLFIGSRQKNRLVSESGSSRLKPGTTKMRQKSHFWAKIKFYRMRIESNRGLGGTSNDFDPFFLNCFLILIGLDFFSFSLQFVHFRAGTTLSPSP